VARYNDIIRNRWIVTTTLGYSLQVFGFLFFLPYSPVIGRTFCSVSSAVYDILRDEREIFFTLLWHPRTLRATGRAPTMRSSSDRSPPAACNVTLGVWPTDCAHVYVYDCMSVRVRRVRVILMNDSRTVRAITVDIMQLLSGYSP